MGNIRHKLLLLFLSTLSSCENYEMRGFFTSYENVNYRFSESIDWNINIGYSEIMLTKRDYTINVMGDSHVGGTRNLDAFIKDSRYENAAAIVMAGDLTSGHKKDYKVFSEHLPGKDSLIYFAVAGNHDLYFDGWKNFYSVFGSSSYYFTINTPADNDLFICLDTGGGTLGDKQLEWFKNLLNTSRKNFRYCVVFTHNNLFRSRPTASTNPMVEEIHILLDLFIQHDVNMVVTAHDHKRNTSIHGNTTHIILDALKDDNNKASYLKLFVSEENINYRFVKL